MSTVTSADGTAIAFERTGAGPAMILIGGAFNDHTTVTDLAALLAPDFTVYVYDRRGRGGSGDQAEYSVQREIEDLAALIEHAGGSAHVFGHSSGGVLALEAGRRGLAIDSLTIYEPPVQGGRGLAGPLRDLIREGRRDDAVALFLTRCGGVPAEFVDGMRADPVWSLFISLAHTLRYDTEICDAVCVDKLATITIRTLTIGGGASEPHLPGVARLVAETIPGARYVTLPGHDHGVLRQPADLVPVLKEFLG
jgi:pimeloyl-ACP methyl ester carboxylesterase